MALITQLQLQAGLKTGLDTVSEFGSLAQIEGDDLLDSSMANLPYAMILTADSYDLTPAPGRMVGTFIIPVIMFFEFDANGWQTSRVAVRDVETAVIEKFHSDGSMWSAGGLDGVKLNAIRAGAMGEIYPTDSTDALPVFITRTMDFELELF